MPKLVGILSGAGAVAVTLVVALTAPPEEGDHGRLKGGASFGVYVKRGESVFKGDSGAVYFPGDRLQFYHSNAEPQHFAIFDVEPSGGVSVFVPFQGAQPVLVPEAREKTLPGSIELDDSEGRERLLGVFCAATFDLGIVTKQLAKLGLAADGASDVLDLGIGPKCSIMSFIINKSRRRE